MSADAGTAAQIVWLRPTLLQRSGAIAFLVFVAVIAILIVVSPHHVSYFDLSTISASATTLALAGIGETIVVIGGGLDLSPGAVISLVNVVLVTQLGAAELGVGTYTALAAAIAIGIGMVIGAINGVLVSYLRLPSLIVTLATMFVARAAPSHLEIPLADRVERFRQSTGRRRDRRTCCRYRY
jgi:ribose transport system permease protein